MLEDFEAHLDKETGRRDGLLDKFNRQSHILFDVKSGVEHLADKLSHLKAVSSSLGQAIVIIIEYKYKTLTLLPFIQSEIK